MSDKLKNIIKERIKKMMEDSSTGAGGATFIGGDGAQTATLKAFNKDKDAPGTASKYYYKLGYELAETDNPGANLGPGPKASETGVKDNYYVKKWKFKPVPKKIKGSGLEVKKLFELDTKYNEFQQREIDALKQIEEIINQLSPALDNARDRVISAYNNDPDSYDVVISTQLALKFLNDALTLLKGEE
jgi:hypothetical protein